MARIRNRAFGRSWIPTLVREGLPITRIVDTIIEMGYGYRRQVMFRDIHEFKGFMDKEHMFRDFDTSLVPTYDMMVETPLTRLKKYRAFGEQHVYNTVTHTYEDRMMSIYTDKLDSLDELEVEFIEDKEKERYKPEEIVEGITWKGVEHNEGWTY